ncbi:radical SAM protein [Candidatus Villigracilis saccharophilus]|uniref:radical SAM protein n=1 Tax=Candidatus Villigracilis saccharophilus TaxID=3140684 RepID=UPI003136EB5D|nr:radical SAM protein [Anaerolineales bacterium]
MKLLGTSFGLSNQPNKPELFLGGYGEPLSHPHILEMIEQAKGLGHRVSLISNGMLLTEQVIHKLIDLKLDMLWVSVDGASPECYVDVRLGDALPTVIENLKQLQLQRYQTLALPIGRGIRSLG